MLPKRAHSRANSATDGIHTRQTPAENKPFPAFASRKIRLASPDTSSCYSARAELKSSRKRCMKAPRKNKRQKSGASRKKQLEALRAESDRALIDLIRRRLALPVEKRLNFLRVRIPGGGSHL
jgi:hypothetical protein